MRLRLIILTLAIMAFLSASTGGWLYYYSYRKAAFQQAEAQAFTKMKLLTDQLSTYLSEHVKPAKTLSCIRELGQALDQTNLETIYQANQILDKFADTLELDVCYLMDHDGVTLCSSNRNRHDSFVGKDFSFRPYFKSAVRGRAATYLALGTTSQKRGVYYSHPVFKPGTTSVQGVVVIKSSIEFVEERLFSGTDHLLLFVNPDGVIFISNRPELRFKLLWQLDDVRLDELANSRQFGNGPWEWTGFSKSTDNRVTHREGSRYVYTRLPVSQHPGWEVVSLRDRQVIDRQLSRPFIQGVGPAVVFISLMTGLLVFFLYQQAASELLQRREAEKKLRLSQERYRDIYHKTPVMLHSIDTQGRIIRVSDHWVEVMGFQRDEVIGRHLTDFFSMDSKRYALEHIFPQFFSTGFCKDVPYTYIKKNQETIDILLSCYGVRDESGNVVRSLAVSVDVTEKNRAQQALEVATEKLSRYSHDLEKQVKQRTEELESAQASLKQLSRNIIASQEREKELVAGELHDQLGQVLTALRFDAVWVTGQLPHPSDKAQERGRKMIRLIDKTIQDVRDMSYRLRPRVLDDLGLADALESLVSDFEKRSTVSCVFQQGPMPEIDKTLATALYRIGQEAVTNAIRHAEAGTITVTLETDDRDLLLIIEDNGRGFEFARNCKPPGFGLEGMMERANLAGGTLEIRSNPGRGTRVCCRITMGGNK